MTMYCYYCMEQIPDETDICPSCGHHCEFNAPVHQLNPGTLLQKRYLVGRALGQGGFGITYIGRDTVLDMRVAIKEYYPNGYSIRNHDITDNVTITASDGDRFFLNRKEKFLKEAKTLARFCGEPGIVGVRDYFEANNTAYIAMEYIDGMTLKRYVSENGPIQAMTLLSALSPLMQTLEKVHAQGVIHRDISPDNIIVMKDGKVKLLDFGAAREVGGDKSLSVMLKLGYAPEEQYRSKGNQGPWTDVYARCATIYFCLTNTVPEESIERFLGSGHELALPSTLGSDITPQQEAVLMRGLSVKKERRIQSMGELMSSLWQARNGKGQHAVDISCSTDQTLYVPKEQKPDPKPAEEKTLFEKNYLSASENGRENNPEEDAPSYQRKQNQEMDTGFLPTEEPEERNDGKTVYQVAEEAGSKPESPKKENNATDDGKKIVIPLILLVTVLLAAAGFLYYKHIHSRDEIGAQTEVEESDASEKPEESGPIAESESVSDETQIVAASPAISTPIPASVSPSTPIPASESIPTPASVSASTPPKTEIPKNTLFADVHPGDSIFFGKYKQNNQTNEELEWKILSVEDNIAFAVSVYAIDCKPFSSDNNSVWDHSTLRSWLNKEFVQMAFSREEQSCLNADSDGDLVSLLSLEQFEELLPEIDNRICMATALAKDHGAYTESDGRCWYWLKSQDSDNAKAMVVKHTGELSADGQKATAKDTCVRPTIRISISGSDFNKELRK